MIGQEKLLARIESYDLKTLPHAMLLIGEEGCGKHILAAELAKRLGIALEAIDETIGVEALEACRNTPLPKGYVIDLGTMSEKSQNKFLKFVEEPGPFAFVILLADSEIGLLQTIVDRCQTFRFERYSVEDLKKIRPGLADEAYELCRTPGRLLSFDERSLVPMGQACAELLAEVGKARGAKILGYSTKLNYKEDYDKFDFLLFFRMLQAVAMKAYLEENDETAYIIYRVTSEYLKELSYKTISKENSAVNYFNRLQEELSKWKK